MELVRSRNSSLEREGGKEEKQNMVGVYIPMRWESSIEFDTRHPFFFNFSYGFTCFRWYSSLPTAVTIIFRLPGSSIVKMGTGGISPRPALPGVLYSAHKRGSGVGGL